MQDGSHGTPRAPPAVLHRRPTASSTIDYEIQLAGGKGEKGRGACGEGTLEGKLGVSGWAGATGSALTGWQAALQSHLRAGAAT
jgi:hypothetical protein